MMKTLYIHGFVVLLLRRIRMYLENVMNNQLSLQNVLKLKYFIEVISS